jgi:hypothetical protein
MGKSNSGEVKKFIRRVKDAGIEVGLDGAGHYSLWLEGKRVGSIPYSPSDWRWRRNAIRDIRASTGIDLRPRSGKKAAANL